MARWGPLFITLFFLGSASAQSSSSSVTTGSSNAGTNASVISVATSVPVATRTTVSAGHTLQITSFAPTTLVLTIAPPSPTNSSATPTTNGTASSTTDNASATDSATPSETPLPVLDTIVDPAFGVLGALLILTGLPSAFLGHKNRWSSFFLTGFYTLALVCISLILKFGVLVAIHPPDKTLRGLYVLATIVAGVAGGGISIFFWQQTKYFIGAWGGFAIGLWVQSFRSGGLIPPIGFRWILYSGCATTGFVLCTIPKLHYHIMILGTAFTGASACMLGVDCFTTAGLKEFYIYNLGFTTLFPKFAGMDFPVSQTMDIEIGFIAALALAGTAVQLRVLQVLKRKLYEINREEQKREAVAEEKAVKRFEHVKDDLEDWEREHGHGKHNSMSEFSGAPLLIKDPEDVPSTPGGESTVVNNQRPRTRSALSDYGLTDGPRPLSRFSQTPGLLPAMNLGPGLDAELPGAAVNEPKFKDPDLLQKEALLAEIQTIRRSIDALRSETDSLSNGESRRPSMSHSRTLSGDLVQAQTQGASSSRVRATRDRVLSMNVLSPFDDQRASDAAGINRPVSTPLRDDDWDAYVRERKLFQPPAGPSAPIAPTYVAPIPRPASEFIPVPDAVAEALAARRQKESALEIGTSAVMGDALMDGKRVSPFAGAPKTHKRSTSLGPINILPPRASTSKPEPEAAAAAASQQPRTHTYEELLERHQQKIRSLQDPLSKQEKADAVLAETKARWERNKMVEKEVMARKLAEQEAALAKKAKDRSKPAGDTSRLPHNSTLDRLGAVGSGGKRLSTAKVQEWQKYQQEVVGELPESPKKPAANTRRRSSAPIPNETGGLPFPNTTAQPRGASTSKRHSRAGIPRDPPS